MLKRQVLYFNIINTNFQAMGILSIISGGCLFSQLTASYPIHFLHNTFLINEMRTN